MGPAMHHRSHFCPLALGFHKFHLFLEGVPPKIAPGIWVALPPSQLRPVMHDRRRLHPLARGIPSISVVFIGFPFGLFHFLLPSIFWISLGHFWLVRNVIFDYWFPFGWLFGTLWPLFWVPSLAHCPLGWLGQFLKPFFPLVVVEVAAVAGGIKVQNWSWGWNWLFPTRNELRCKTVKGGVIIMNCGLWLVTDAHLAASASYRTYATLKTLTLQSIMLRCSM